MRWFTSCFIAFVTMAAQYASCSELDVHLAQIGALTAVATTRWSVVRERESLVAAVVIKNDLTRLQILRKGHDGWALGADFLIGDHALNMFVTADEDGYLITQWVTASGYVVKVFEYVGEGEVARMVLDVGAKALPDLVMSPGADFDVAVIIRRDEPGVAARGGSHDNAAIFKLRRGAAVKNVVAPWRKRFDVLKSK